MRTLGTSVALFVVAIALSCLLCGEKTGVSTHALAVKAPAASPRTAGEHEVARKRGGPDPAAIVGLMMMLGAQQGR